MVVYENELKCLIKRSNIEALKWLLLVKTFYKLTFYLCVPAENVHNFVC